MDSEWEDLEVVCGVVLVVKLSYEKEGVLYIEIKRIILDEDFIVVYGCIKEII